MNKQEETVKQLVDAMRFRVIQPKQEPFRGYYILTHYLKRAGIHFDILNTKIPAIPNLREIRSLKNIPRMSTIANAAIINEVVRTMPEDTIYLNVGVWHGYSFFSGMLGNSDKKCIGIDNFSMWGGPREAFLKRFHQYKSPAHQFFDLDYIDYFSKEQKNKIGFYFYDGDHKYEHQLKGLQLAAPYMADGGIMMVDDTNWDAPRKATLDFMNERKGEYKIILDVNTHPGRGPVNTSAMHPTYWNGLMLIQKKTK